MSGSVPSASALQVMPVWEIAYLISKDWRPVWFGAVPYVRAMSQLDSVDDMYGADDGRTVVLYFLSNAAQWRGETARAVKAELKRRVRS